MDGAGFEIAAVQRGGARVAVGKAVEGQSSAADLDEAAGAGNRAGEDHIGIIAAGRQHHAGAIRPDAQGHDRAGVGTAKRKNAAVIFLENELERFGDLATNIAERIIYIVTGKLHEINVDPG